MKRFIITLFSVAAFYSTATAQNNTQSVMGAEVKIDGFDYKADSVLLNLDFDLEDLKIGANESIVFTPKMFKGEKTISLPSVVVERRGGTKSYKRAMALSPAKGMAKYSALYGSPYDIVEFYGKDKKESVDYSVTIPYETWMVGSELYVDCTTCGCCKSVNSGMIVPEERALMIDIPEVEIYEPTPQVELVKPEKVAVKRRDIQYSSALIFRVNSTYIDPNLEGNKGELASIDNMMQSVISDSDYTITGVNIIGYASPEGSLESNMRLSKGRATSLERLMKRDYKMIKPDLYSVNFGGENWDKLYDIVSESNEPWRDDVLDIIDNYTIEEGRETKLMALNGGKTYQYLLKNIFPSTRLVVVDVDYNIDAYDLVRIGELIDTKPQNLSLEEMYRLSETYEIEDNEFEKIFMTAVQVYPNDEVALNNALVTEIRRGNLAAINDLVDRVDDDTESAELANSLGAYYLMSEDYDMASKMFKRAMELGSGRAEYNMDQLTKKLENIELIEENKAFRAKIYGE